MLVVNFIGGLGNQMFQYAFGRAIALKRELPVKFNVIELLDRTPKENFTFRNYELDIFAAEIAIASEEEVAIYNYQPKSLPEKVYYKVKRKLLKPQVFKERAYYTYDPDVYRSSENTYYDGYWQTEQYFQEFASVLRKDLAFKTEPQGQNATLAKQIQASNAIAVHVRRGDYVSNAISNQVHGTCSPEYYRQAVDILRQQVSNPVLFVFSDEPEWVQQNLAFDLPTVYVSHNKGQKSFEDMRLMSLCQHNIIANSSFSWWGAWLNDNPKKQVIAPRQWMQSEVIDSSGLTPASWIRL